MARRDLRPYFLWDEDVSIGELQQILAGPESPQRDELLGKMLREARDIASTEVYGLQDGVRGNRVFAEGGVEEAGAIPVARCRWRSSERSDLIPGGNATGSAPSNCRARRVGAFLEPEHQLAYVQLYGIEPDTHRMLLAKLPGWARHLELAGRA